MKKEIVFLIIIVFIPIFGIFIGIFLSTADAGGSGSAQTRTETAYYDGSTASGKTAGNGQGTAGNYYTTGSSGGYNTAVAGGSSTGSYTENGTTGSSRTVTTVGGTSTGMSGGNSTNSANSGITTGNVSGSGENVLSDEELQQLIFTIFYNAGEIAGSSVGEAMEGDNLYSSFYANIKKYIQVDLSGTKDISVTFAKRLFSGVSEENLQLLIQNPALVGCRSIRENTDGSLTLYTSNSQYNEELAGLGELYGQMLSEMAAEGDSVFHIDFNDDLTWFAVTTYSSEVGDEEEYYVSAIYAISVCYHIFAGAEPEAITIEFVNYPTGVSLGVLDSRNL